MKRVDRSVCLSIALTGCRALSRTYTERAPVVQGCLQMKRGGKPTRLRLASGVSATNRSPAELMVYIRAEGWTERESGEERVETTRVG